MENKEEEKKSYLSLNNCWDYVINYLDINSLFQLELTSKFFRKQIENYYEVKEKTKIVNREKKSNKNKENNIKLYKQNFLSKYFNLITQISIKNKEFCNEDSIKENNELLSYNLNKEIFPKIESTFFKNKLQIEQLFFHKNQFFILYSNNIFMIIEYENELKSFKVQFQHDFKFNIIKNFTYSKNENIILFLQENSNVIYFLNLNYSDKEIKKYENQENFNLEENIDKIYLFKEFILFLNHQDEFFFIPNEIFFVNKNEEDKKEKKEEEEEEIETKEKIQFPIKLENTYGKIKKISSTIYNIILLNNENQIYSIPMTEHKKGVKTKLQIPKFKLLFDQKFNDFYSMNCSDNYFILLEKKIIPPFIKWKTEEIYNWFEEMGLDDYLNIIKYKNITGRDIIQGGKDYLIDFMGMQEDHLNKINYEISTIKNGSSKNMKLWGFGSNKNGQLGLINYNNFAKFPVSINLPNLIEDDTIEKIFCGKNFSVLLTKFGNVFITGNYNVKEKSEDKNNNIVKENYKGKNDNKKKKKGNKKKNKKNRKDFEKENIKNEKKEDETQLQNENKWINISKDICYCHYTINELKIGNDENENSYFKIKDILLFDDNILFLGYYSNEIPFSAILKKPKFKHLKKGGKFITSTKVIEHIQEFLKDKIDDFKVVYGDFVLKTLESPLDEFIESEIPHHKIVQIKTKKNEIIWDRKKRYFKDNFMNENLNKNK